ncbi:MAG TPA: hypothetical protein VJ770_27175 [Stellaceae bacterium]|nr:hypothetical protein [Stellaceae bacterium]
MTPEEVEAAAWCDPDMRPFTPEEMTKARRVPRDWEQGRSESDQPDVRLRGIGEAGATFPMPPLPTSGPVRAGRLEEGCFAEGNCG